MRATPYSFRYLDIWLPAGGTVWGILGGLALLEEYITGMSFRVYKHRNSLRLSLPEAISCGGISPHRMDLSCRNKTVPGPLRSEPHPYSFAFWSQMCWLWGVDTWGDGEVGNDLIEVWCPDDFSSQDSLSFFWIRYRLQVASWVNRALLFLEVTCQAWCIALHL